MNSKTNKKTKGHQDLGDFNFGISPFGEISGNLEIDKINDFLNQNLEDKKLSNTEKGV